MQQESVKKAEVAASNAMQDVQNYTAAAAAASSQPAWLPKQPSADQGTCVVLGCNVMLVYAGVFCQVCAEPTIFWVTYGQGAADCFSMYICHVTAKQAFHMSLIFFQSNC